MTYKKKKLKATHKAKKPKSDKFIRNHIISKMRLAFVYYSEAYKNVKKNAKAPYGKYYCACCGGVTAEIIVEHLIPIVPIDKGTHEIGLEEYYKRLFCDESNLAVFCKTCADEKTQAENMARVAARKQK